MASIVSTELGHSFSALLYSVTCRVECIGMWVFWARDENEGQILYGYIEVCYGEGNDNPLQCSCLENPRDGGAWWAAVYGVTQSRTRLKWLSSSSSSSSSRDLLWKYIVSIRFSKFFFIFWTHEWLRTLVHCMNAMCWKIRKPSDWSVHNPSRKAIASFPRWGFMSFVSGLKSESCSVVSNSLWPHGLYSPWNSSGQNTGVGSLSLLQGIPSSEIEPRSPALWTDSLPAESQGKFKNTAVGRLFLLQGIFLTQESNWGLLHCRWILYQLSYEGGHKFRR